MQRIRGRGRNLQLPTAAGRFEAQTALPQHLTGD
jgi:hypothetical protein